MTPERRRVLMLLENCSYPRDSRVRHEAETLTQNGYHVSVISPNQKDEAWREVVNGVHVYRFPMPPSADGAVGYIWEYLYSSACIFVLSLWVVLREGVDTLHAHNPPDVFFVLVPLIRLWNINFVYDHHDLSPELYDARFDGHGSTLLRNLLMLCETLSYKVASHVIVPNASYRQVAIDRGHVPPQRVTIVRNGPDEILPIQAKNHDGNTIVYVGSMGFHDGVEYLLRAVHSLIHDIGFRDFHCILAGNGDAFESLQQLTADLNITAWVEFKGWLAPADVTACLRMADICAAPEPFNPYNDCSTMIKMMEYMAAGKPIVAFDLTEHRYTAEDAALYARPNDVSDYARQIMLLIENPQRCAEMGLLGQQRIATELLWDFQAQVLLTVYDHLSAQTLHRLIRA